MVVSRHGAGVTESRIKASRGPSRRQAAGAFLLALILSLLQSSFALAHRSGCHRWHSCPSDRATYICGDLGYCSQCPDNEYCEGGQPRLVQKQPESRGVPPPTGQLGVSPLGGWTCPQTHPIKGNFTTSSGERCIYHLPGGGYYEKTKPERCYATEEEAQQDGCRRSKR